MSLHPSALARDFGTKLRLTAAVLGCTHQKDLALAFQRANPKTTFDLTRSYKWMQGRTLPRSGRLYEEWAMLVDLGRTAEDLLACNLDEFRALLAERYGPARLAAIRADRRPENAAAPAAIQGETGPLHGSYACYSHAQSPYFRGRVIRGSLRIVFSAESEVAMAHYAQCLPTGIARCSGPVRMYGQTPCLEMHGHSAALAPVFVTLFRPTPPTTVLIGIMSSFTVIDPGNQPPYATRFVAVRTPEMASAELEASNRYLSEAEWPPSADLAALGLATSAAPEMDACMEACLGQAQWLGSDRPSSDAAMQLVSACDRTWLATSAALAA
ncbi:hypothetical protein [Muricoccus aerilatus]|uniref:hypothetical protein n=1 Tax=Muricoccus aerilatus TaxID=452982 RepID=UPI0006947F4F|nr:hypothetical protein [Roseomonas aerilata]